MAHVMRKYNLLTATHPHLLVSTPSYCHALPLANTHLPVSPPMAQVFCPSHITY